METYIAKKENGKWVLVNGNSESKNEWGDYEDAKEAMLRDNKLQAEANLNNPDLYHDNTIITWI